MELFQYNEVVCTMEDVCCCELPGSEHKFSSWWPQSMPDFRTKELNNPRWHLHNTSYRGGTDCSGYHEGISLIGNHFLGWILKPQSIDLDASFGGGNSTNICRHDTKLIKRSILKCRPDFMSSAPSFEL